MRSSNSNHRDTATRATEVQNGWCRRYVIRSKPTKSKSRRTQESPSKPTAHYSHGYHDTQQWQYTRFHKRQDSTTTAYEKIRHMSYQSPILLVGEAVACRRPGALVNKLESAWLEGIWLGRDSKTDEHLNRYTEWHGRSRALKRRVERRRWDVTLLNAISGIRGNRHQSREEDR